MVRLCVCDQYQKYEERKTIVERDVRRKVETVVNIADRAISGNDIFSRRFQKKKKITGKN